MNTTLDHTLVSKYWFSSKQFYVMNKAFLHEKQDHSLVTLVDVQCSGKWQPWMNS